MSLKMKRTKLGTVFSAVMFLSVWIILFQTYVLHRSGQRKIPHRNGFEITNDKTKRKTFYTQDEKITENPKSKQLIEQPLKNTIAFIKTHKTASSTMTNILQRYGDKNNLTFALPNTGIWLGWPAFFNPKDPLPFPPSFTRKFDILCNHARYNHDAMDKVLHSTTNFITILRNPVTQYESLFSYMGIRQLLRIPNETENGLELFLENPRKFLDTSHQNYDDGTMNLIQNGMFFDLGFTFNESSKDSDIKSAILKLHSEFSLVLITEYFDESLVLLKRIFNWTTEDIVYFKLNQRRVKRQITNKEMIRKIIEWNKADYELYTFFNQTFWNRIAKVNASLFYDEVQELRRRRRQLEEACLEFEPDDGKIIGYNLKENLRKDLKEICSRMKMSVPHYTNFLRIKSFLPPDAFKDTNLSQIFIAASGEGRAGYTRLMRYLSKDQRHTFIINIRNLRRIQANERRHQRYFTRTFGESTFSRKHLNRRQVLIQQRYYARNDQRTFHERALIRFRDK